MKTDRFVQKAIDLGVLRATRRGEVFSSRWSRPLGCVNGRGYRVFTLHLDGERKQIKSHRAVWIFFNGITAKSMVIDHINRNKSDNRLSNLRAVSEKENSANRRAYGGENNPAAKVTKAIAVKIRNEHKTGWSYTALATQFKVSKTTIANIIRGDSWV